MYIYIYIYKQEPQILQRKSPAKTTVRWVESGVITWALDIL